MSIITSSPLINNTTTTNSVVSQQQQQTPPLDAQITNVANTLKSDDKISSTIIDEQRHRPEEQQQQKVEREENTSKLKRSESKKKNATLNKFSIIPTSKNFLQQKSSSSYSSSSISSSLHQFPYFFLFLLFICQLIVYLQNHSHLGGLTLWDTALLLIVNADLRIAPFKWLLLEGGGGEEFLKKTSTTPTTTIDRESRPLLLVVGAVTFQALLFYNFTHALEAIFCADSTSRFSTPFVVMVILSVLFKLPLLLFSNNTFLLPIRDLSLASRLFLHFGASTATLGLFGANWHFSNENDLLISRYDRYFGAFLCLLLSLSTFSIFGKNLPFLLCDSPEGIDANDLKIEIEQKLSPIRCQHIHIYRKWPSTKCFDAILHIQIIEKSGKKNSEQNSKMLGEIACERRNEEKELFEIMRNLNKFLKEKGAQKVNIQPLFGSNSSMAKKWCCVCEEKNSDETKTTTKIKA